MSQNKIVNFVKAHKTDIVVGTVSVAGLALTGIFLKAMHDSYETFLDGLNTEAIRSADEIVALVKNSELAQ